jgi:hypothetical protein
MLDFFPAGVKLAFAVGALILIGLGANWVYNHIYDRGYAAASTKYEAEEAAMARANQVAITNAEKGLREDIAALSAENQKLEDERVQLDVQADQDPAAHSGGIKRSGVQRLNAER